MKRAYRSFLRRHKISISIIQIAVITTIVECALWTYQGYQVNAKMAQSSFDISAQSMLVAAQKQHLSQELIAQLDKSAHIKTSNTQKELSKFWIAKYFGKDAPVAEKVFTCESNLNPMALNDKNTNGSSDLGIPQINSVHAKEFEKMYSMPFKIGAHDTEISIKYAKYIYDHQSWSPWVCAGIVKAV
jgi:hypothetical protein